ncbi:hypothetical protein [Aeromonas dhakensis]|uniref:hypothetical protein n=1 Tax=Aeromonas dhakensis TaxID=196024 RepID=UPI0039858C27
MTEQISLQMRASGLVVALLGIGGLWMAIVFGSEFMDLQALTPADPLRVNDWRGWFAIFVGLLAAPFMLYAGGKLMFSREMPEPNLSSKVVRQRGDLRCLADCYCCRFGTADTKSQHVEY